MALMNRVNPVLLLLPMLTPTLIVATLTQMQLCGKRQQGLWVGSKQIYPTDRQWTNWKLAPVAARVLQTGALPRFPAARSGDAQCCSSRVSELLVFGYAIRVSLGIE